MAVPRFELFYNTSRTPRLAVTVPTEVLAQVRGATVDKILADREQSFRRRYAPTRLEPDPKDDAATRFVVNSNFIARAGTHVRGEELPPIHQTVSELASLPSMPGTDPVRSVRYEYAPDEETVDFAAQVAIPGATGYRYMQDTTKAVNNLAVSLGLSQFGHPKASTGIRFDPDKQAITMRMPSGAALRGRYDAGNSLRPPLLTLEANRPVGGVEPLVLLGAAIILARTR